MLSKSLDSRLHFNLKLAVALAIVPAMAFAAQSAGKVRSLTGEVDRMKINQTEWKPLSGGAPIFQSDRVRTGVESEVQLAINDGSVINIAENAEVELSNLLQPNEQGGFETRLDIKKGHIDFNVQKLDKKSKFEFKTGTATASIRGTSGYIGGEGVFFAGLKTGKLDIKATSSGQQVSVLAGETTIGTDSLVVLKLASSGDARFAKRLEKILANKSATLEQLISSVQKEDSTFQKEEADRAKNVSMNSFTVTTQSPVDVCDKGLVVEGSYQTNDEAATLVLKVGNSYQSENLVHAADGAVHTFAQNVAISDENGLWNESRATLTFVGGQNKSSQNIDIRVNKSCSEVNTKSPTVSIASYDSLRCVANVSAGNMKGDAGVINADADGSSVLNEAISKDVQKRVQLKTGSHEYTVSVKDQAGNEASASRTMGCYPKKHFSVEILGKEKETLKVPPPPKDVDDIISKTLQFRIKIPENNPDLLYKVVVKQDGKTILQETLSQIQNLDYQVPVELERKSANRFEIEVTHKSGYKAKAKKVYEVR